MSFTETRLVNPRQLTTSASTALYEVPVGKSAIIKQIVITNTTGTTATFTFYINGFFQVATTISFQKWSMSIPYTRIQGF